MSGVPGLGIWGLGMWGLGFRGCSTGPCKKGPRGLNFLEKETLTKKGTYHTAILGTGTLNN